MTTVIEPKHEGAAGALAPVEPGRDYLNEARDQAELLKIEDDLHKYLIKLVDNYEKKDEHEWRQAKTQMVRSRNYFDNRQYGYVVNGAQWVDYQKKKGEINYTKNVYQAHILSAQMEMSRGQVELNFSHVAPNSHRGNLIKKVAETRYLTHKKRLFSASKRDQENLSGLLNGIMARYTFFEWESDEKVPKFGQKTGEMVDKAVVCAECYAPSVTKPCPSCGSNETQEIEAQPMSLTAVEGYDKIRYGSNNWVSVDPLGLTFYIRATTVRETPYLIWRQSILQDVLQSKYKDVKIVSESNEAVDYQVALDASTPNAQTSLMRGKADASPDFIQAWFDYGVYCHRKIDKNVLLRNGRVLRRGMTLGEAFPNGMYLAINGKTVLDMWGEDKNRKWTICPYVARIGTMVGGGTSAALDSQDRINDFLNLHVAVCMRDGFAKEFVKADYLESENIPDDPRERAVIRNVEAGVKIVGDIIDRMPAAAISGDAYALEDKDSALIQMQLGTFSGASAGAPDLKAVQDTASGFLAWRQMTVGRFAPMLSLKADMLDKEQAYQLLENDQQYLTPQQWKQIQGDYSADAVKLFKECDLRQELLIEVVGESYMPQGSQDKQAKVMAFGEAMTAIQLDPESEMAAYMADKFDIPTSLIGFDAYYSATMTIIEGFRMVSEMIIAEFGDTISYNIKDPQVFSLAQLVIHQTGIEIVPSMDNHQAIINALKDWWIKDEGRAASNLLKATVALFEQQHELGTATDMASQAELGQIANAPMVEQEMVAQEQAVAAQGEQANAQMANEEAARESELGGKLLDEMSAERQREHDIEIKEMEGKQADKQAKAQAKKASAK